MAFSNSLRKIVFSLLTLFIISASAAHVMSWVPSYFIDECLDASNNGTLTMDFGGVTMGDGLTHLSLQFWAPNPSNGSIYYIANGGRTATDTDVNRFVAWGNSNNVKTMLCVYNNDGSWNWNLVKPILDNPTSRNNFANSLVAEMERLSLDGVELDLEGEGTEANADKTNFFLFLNDLISKVSAKGKIVTVAGYHYIYNQPSQLWWDEMVDAGVEAITSMGYTDIGANAADWHAYSFQKNAMSDPTHLMLGMPTYAGTTWQGDAVQTHVNWAVDNGVGIGIWDASLGDGNGTANTAWRTAEVWNKIAEIKGSTSPTPDPGGELIKNGDFASGTTNWILEVDASASATGAVSSGTYVTSISNGGSEDWHVQLAQYDIPLIKGKTYQFNFDAKATANRSINWGFYNNGEWYDYGAGSANLTSTMQHFSKIFTMDSTSDTKAYLALAYGLSTIGVTVDNLSLKEYTGALPSTYTITASAGSGGTISPTGAVSVDSADNSTFTITPSSGYEIADVVINGVSQGAISAYTFLSVTADQTISATFNALPAGSIAFPFPQQLNYGTKPSLTQTTLNSDITTRYDWWKANYLISENGMYHIKALSTEESGDVKTVSEAQGYGMMIVAIMAGYDSNAQSYFDGLVAFYENYKRYNNLMDWRVWSNGTYDEGSAVDGDLDIAYALILAYKQWGDNAYLTKAQAIIDNIWTYEIFNSSNLLPTPGDQWYSAGVTYSSNTVTRPSDWMAGHFKAFAQYTNDDWLTAADSIYSFYNSHANTSTGLVPDFYKGYSEAPANEVESRWDGEYYYNACRVPLRFAMDYANNQNSDAQNALTKIGDWINSSSNGQANNVYSGYYRDGDVISGQNYTDVSFMGPFGAGLIATSHQGLMTSIWNEIKEDYLYEDDHGTPNENSYSASLGILSMLVMSGNWWSPTTTAAPTTYTITATANGDATISPSGTTTVNEGASQTYTITVTDGSQIDSLKVDGNKVTITNSYTFSNITANHTIEVWASETPTTTYAVTTTAQTGGTISPSGTTQVAEDGSFTFDITPNTGYVIDNVTLNGTSLGAISSYTILNISEAQTVVATFKVATYTLTPTAGANGAISPTTSVTVNYGDDQTFTITPATGYEVEDVKIDNISVGAQTSYTFSSVDTNHSIAATFKVQTFTIAITNGIGGTVTPAGSISLPYGDDTTITITPSSGYLIDKVLVDGVDKGALSTYTFTNVVANHTLEVSYKVDTTPHNNELIINGSFDDAKDNWTLEKWSDTIAGTARIVNGEYRQRTTTKGSELWELTTMQQPFVMTQGKFYRLTYDAHGTNSKVLAATIQMQDSAWDTYYYRDDTLSTTLTHYQSIFKMTHTTDSIASLQFQGGVGLGDIFIDNVSLTERIDSAIVLTSHEADSLYNGGDQTTITWESTSDISQVSLYYSKDGTSWITIAENITNSGSYRWAVPNDSITDAVIKVVAYNTDVVSSISEGVITITYQPTITTTERDSTKQEVVRDTLVDTTLSGTTGKEDTLVVTTVVDSIFDSTWHVIDTLHDGVYHSSKVTFTSEVITVDIISTDSDNKPYIPTITTSERDSTKQEVVRDTLVDTTLSGTAGKEDTLIVTTVNDTITDSTWTISDTLSDGIVTATGTKFKDVVITIKEVSTNSIKKPYLPTISTKDSTYSKTDTLEVVAIDSVVQENLDTVVTTLYSDSITTYEILQKDTLHDGDLFKRVYDTLSTTVIIVATDTIIDTLIYNTPTGVIPPATTREPVVLAPSIIKRGGEALVIALPQAQTYRVRIFDATGRKYLDKEGVCSERLIRWTPQDLASGQYLVILETTSASGRQEVRRGMFGVQR